jgi:hypothetical protein
MTVANLAHGVAFLCDRTIDVQTPASADGKTSTPLDGPSHGQIDADADETDCVVCGACQTELPLSAEIIASLAEVITFCAVHNEHNEHVTMRSRSPDLGDRQADPVAQEVSDGGRRHGGRGH